MAVKDQTSSFEPKPFGRYVLLNKLAVGGMAEIYKAKTYGVDGFEKQLAIKRILPHCAADKEFINMLVDEAKLTVLLSHANIVQVFDLGKVGDDYFISMEYINGTNLRELMSRFHDRGEKMPEEVAVYIASEICKGLDYAHRKTDSQGSPLHIVHRDISPQNILISYEGEVKIVDFGIAKAALNVSHTMAGILKGKIAYMSSEQALGKPIDHRTDIFSMGVVLYEMLTDEKLFTGETQFEVLNQIRTTRINTLMLPDLLSGPLKAILAKALAYNPKDRYQGAGDFQLDLTKYLYSSYIDFSPRLLAGVTARLFESEIRKKEPVVTLNEQTRSVLAKQTSPDDIVVHRTAETLPLRDTAVSEIRTAPTERRRARPVAFLAGGTVIALLAGYLGYAYLLKDRKTALPPGGAVLPSEEAGQIVVETTPPGARILLNGNDTGLTTPATLPKLAVGEEYQVRLMKDNYREFSKTVPLTSEAPVTLQEVLQPFPNGVIEIDSTPPGAKVSVNGRDLGVSTPTKVENLEIQKSYQVTLSLPNHYEWTGSTELNDFTPAKLYAALTPVPPPTPTLTPPPLPAPPSTPPAIPSAPPAMTPTPAPTPTPPPPVKKATPTPAPTPAKPPAKKAPPTPTPAPVEEGTDGGPVDEPVEEPSPPPPARTTETNRGGASSLSVNSDPSGAEVYINAEYKGTTPLKVGNIPAGTVKVVVSKEGYMRYTTSLRVKAGETASLGTVRLGGQYGEVSVRSTPARAAVFFDGEQIGARTPVTIRRVPRDRSHSLRVRLDGYRDWEATVNLRDQDSKKYDVLLERVD